MVSWPPRTRIIGCNHVVCTLTATRTSCGLSSTAMRTSPPASPAASRALPLAWPSASSTTPASVFRKKILMDAFMCSAGIYAHRLAFIILYVLLDMLLDLLSFLFLTISITCICWPFMFRREHQDEEVERSIVLAHWS